MAFPYLSHYNGEDGLITDAGFAETDTESRIALKHYSVLAKNLIYPNAIPYNGAYCLHGDLSINDGTPADAYVAHTTPFVLAASGTLYVRFYVLVTSNLTMAAADRFDILELRSAAVVEAAIGIVNSSGTYRIGVSETAASTQTMTDLILDKWHAIELKVVLDSGANDGTLDFYVDGYQVGAQVTTLTQAALESGRWGVMGQDANTTAGHVLLDSLIVDDARIYPNYAPNSATLTTTKTSHLALGPGCIKSYSLLGGLAADNILELYDTDEANTLSAQTMIGPPLTNQYSGQTVRIEEAKGVYFQRGLFVKLTGTNPRAQVTFKHRLESPGNIKDYALQRKVHAPF